MSSHYTTIKLILHLLSMLTILPSDTEFVDAGASGYVSDVIKASLNFSELVLLLLVNSCCNA